MISFERIVEAMHIAAEDVGNRPSQPGVLPLQFPQPPGLIDLQTAVRLRQR